MADREVHVFADDDISGSAMEIAVEAIEVFSLKYPKIRMNLSQWGDLKECVEREVRGHFGISAEKISARDLCRRMTLKQTESRHD